MRATVRAVDTGTETLTARRPLWQEVGLSALYTAGLVGIGVATSLIGDRAIRTGNGARDLTVFSFLVIVPLLVVRAYPPGARRWWHWLLYELCIVFVFTAWLPLVYLPWLIVTRKAQRAV